MRIQGEEREKCHNQIITISTKQTKTNHTVPQEWGCLQNCLWRITKVAEALAVWCAVCSMCAVCCVQYGVCVQHAVCHVQYVCSVQCVVYSSVPCAVCTQHAACCVQCVCSVQYAHCLITQLHVLHGAPGISHGQHRLSLSGSNWSIPRM